MEKAGATILLEQLIRAKEAERALNGKLLKEQFRLTYQSLKPLNIVKSSLKEVINSPELKTDLVKAAVGFGASYLIKKFFSDDKPGLLSKLFTFIERNEDSIKAFGGSLMNKMTKQNADHKKTAD